MEKLITITDAASQLGVTKKTLKDVWDRKRMDGIFICNFCRRPQPEVTSMAGRKCICCGNAKKYSFSHFLIRKGVVYIYAEQRLKTVLNEYEE
jgi:hypothetical protein